LFELKQKALTYSVRERLTVLKKVLLFAIRFGSLARRLIFMCHK